MDLIKTSIAGNWIKKLYKNISGNKGFTLIELIIVIVIISITSIVVITRMSGSIGNKRENFAIFTGMIVKTFDDSFLNDRINYFTIHLNSADLEDEETKDDIFNRRNGISVLNLIDGKFHESKRKILKHREFSESFIIEEVVLSSGEVIGLGNVLISFYPQGYSDNIIIHILLNGDERWSIKINKHLKEPEVIEEYITFEDI